MYQITPDVYETMKGIEYLNFIADAFKVPQDKRVFSYKQIYKDVWHG